MSAKGFYASQEGHIAPLLFPVNITGGEASLTAFSMANYAHATIVFLVGVSAAAEGLITLNACSAAAGTGATAIAFDIFKCETTNTDVLGARTAVPATGYQPPATDNIWYAIELDAQQLPAGLDYVQLALANTTNSVIAAALVILSGARFGGDQSPTVLT